MAFAKYAVELVDGNGRVVQGASRLRPASADGALFVSLKRTSFDPGKYNCVCLDYKERLGSNSENTEST